MPYGQIIINELEHEIVYNKKGCIVINAGIFFPYLNGSENPLIFSIDINRNPLKNTKLNHRYPNRRYYTITRKYGRRVSKIGYPYFINLSDKPQRLLLTIHVGVGEKVINICVPVVVHLTEDLPCCSLNLNFMFETCEFSIISYRKDEDGWYYYSWTAAKEVNVKKHEHGESIGTPTIDIKTHTLFFQREITPFPQKMEDLFVL